MPAVGVNFNEDHRVTNNHEDYHKLVNLVERFKRGGRGWNVVSNDAKAAVYYACKDD